MALFLAPRGPTGPPLRVGATCAHGLTWGDSAEAGDPRRPGETRLDGAGLGLAWLAFGFGLGFGWILSGFCMDFGLILVGFRLDFGLDSGFGWILAGFGFWLRLDLAYSWLHAS